MVAVFVLGGLATLYLMAMFLSGICFRMRRRWPPTAISRGQAAEIWGMSVLAFGCAYLAPSLGTASSPLPEALRHWGGGALLGIGNLIAGLAVVDLGLAQTTGAMGPLCPPPLLWLVAASAVSGSRSVALGLGTVVWHAAGFAAGAWGHRCHGSGNMRRGSLAGGPAWRGLRAVSRACAVLGGAVAAFCSCRVLANLPEKLPFLSASIRTAKADQFVVMHRPSGLLTSGRWKESGFYCFF